MGPAQDSARHITAFLTLRKSLLERLLTHDLDTEQRKQTVGVGVEDFLLAVQPLQVVRQEVLDFVKAGCPFLQPGFLVEELGLISRASVMR